MTGRQPSIVFLTPDELLQVMRTAHKRSVRDWAALLLTYCHGLRTQETCNLTVNDVDVKGGQIVVRRLKGSLQTTQQLMPHKGEPLLDELKRCGNGWESGPLTPVMHSLSVRRVLQNKTSPYNDLSANGNNPVNSLSQHKGPLH